MNFVGDLSAVMSPRDKVGTGDLLTSDGMAYAIVIKPGCIVPRHDKFALQSNVREVFYIPLLRSHGLNGACIETVQCFTGYRTCVGYTIPRVILANVLV